MNTHLLIVFGLVAVCALLLIVAGVKRRPQESSDEDVMERMGRFASREELLKLGEAEPNAREKLAGGVEQAFKGKKIASGAASLLARADSKLTVGEFLLVRAASALVAFAVGFFALSSVMPALGVLLGIFVALIAFMIPSFVMSFLGKRRRKKFTLQLGDTISLMANSLRAGYSLLQTMEMVARETKDPIGGEFKRVIREVGLGISIQVALDHLLERIPSEDLDFLVTAINIQHEVGGNLAQILNTIGHTIRERVRIQGEIGVLTAQVQLSGTIVTLVPVGLAAFLFLINPSYMSALFVWPYLIMPIASLLMTTAGFFAMRKIATIEV